MAMTRTIGVAYTYLLEVLENESVMNDALAVVLKIYSTLHTREMTADSAGGWHGYLFYVGGHGV